MFESKHWYIVAHVPARSSDEATVGRGAYRVLEPGLIDTLRRYGVERPAAAEDTLVAAGAASFDFCVIIEGGVDVVHRTIGQDDTIVASLGSGQFVGSLALLTGEQVQVSATVSTPSLVLAISLMSSERSLSRSRPSANSSSARSSAAVPPARRDEHGGQTPLALETSRPGVICVGDARAAKRVAVAVGEGAIAVRMIHERLKSRLSSNLIQQSPTTNGELQHV
jgi:Cyclic nucleotide-binding domain